MYDYIYYMYIRFYFTHIDITARVQESKSFLVSHIWSQTVASARMYGTDMITI